MGIPSGKLDGHASSHPSRRLSPSTLASFVMVLL